MSAPQTSHYDVYFVQRDGTSCDRETKPTFSASHLLGEVETVTFRNDSGVQVFQKWNANTGRHEDHTVFPVQEVATAVIAVKELSAVFRQQLRRAMFTISGGSGTYKYGSSTGSTIRFPGEGWIKFVEKDGRTVTLDSWESYGYMEITEHAFGRGTQTATFNWRKLYAALHDSTAQGAWTNIQ